MAVRSIFGVLGGLLLAAWATSATWAQPQAVAMSASAASGQALFQQSCAACHGADAKGGVKLGDATAADLRWQTLGPTYHNDPALVTRAITQGLDQDGQALDDVMPRWQGKLTAAQVQDIVAYLQTLTTAVPGQIVATPEHEEATPPPTEEAQESAAAASVISQARVAVASSAVTSAAATSPTTAANEAATPVAAPTTGDGGGNGGGTPPVAWLGLAAVVVILGALGIWQRGRGRP